MWYKNISELFSSYDIWIGKHTKTIDDKVNAITRFILLYSLILSLYYQTYLYIGVGILVVFVFACLHMYTNSGTSEQQKVYDNDCREISKDNPYGNPSIFEQSDRFKPACDNNREMMDKLYHQNTFFTPQDVFKKDGGARQFVSVPKNDQSAFAKYLYDNEPNCRVDKTKCTGGSYR